MSAKREFSINVEQLSAYLKDAVARVRSEEDPEEMNELKKIFKKNVPFGMRSYVAAYLAKQSSGGGRGYYSRRDRGMRHSSYRDSMHMDRDRGERLDHSEKRGVESMGMKPPVSRAVIAEEFAKTIFISIGRNRRVYARDLIALISQGAGVERERIGDIKIYDNYSFVTLFAEDAAKVIELLNGYEYRGRMLNVSYSRKKETGGEEASSYANPSADYSAGASGEGGAASAAAEGSE